MESQPEDMDTQCRKHPPTHPGYPQPTRTQTKKDEVVAKGWVGGEFEEGPPANPAQHEVRAPGRTATHLSKGWVGRWVGGAWG